MKHLPTPKRLRFVLIAVTAVFGFGQMRAAEPLLRVLIFSGQNHHNWRETTPQIESILECSGRFTVEVTEPPERGEAATLQKHDIRLSNGNTFGKPAVTHWPPAMRTAFLDFVRNGKGFVSVHAGSSSFYDRPEYQQLAGGSWKLGQTGHGPPPEFTVKLVAPNHPATFGLTNFVIINELWHRTGLQTKIQVLATACSAPEMNGTGKDELVAFTTGAGQGRGFNRLPGHDAKAMESPGFQQMLQRGPEWAATGTVSTSQKVKL